MGLLDELFAGGQTPWAKEQMARMLGQPPGMDAPAPAARMNVGGPAPAPQAAPQAAFADPGIGGAEILGALLQGAGGIAGPLGQLIGQSSARERDAMQKNETYKLLINRGLDADTARMAVTNPEIGKSILGTMFGPKKAPEIVKIPGPYGTEKSVIWDSESGTYKDASTVLGGDPAASPAEPATGPAPGMAVTARETPETPSPAAVVAQPGAAAPNLGAGPAGGALEGLSGMAGRLPGATPAPAPAASPAAPAPAAIPAGYRVGPGVPKPPEGFINNPSPDGRGFLWQPDGLPAFEPKAEAEARAKAKGEADAAIAGQDRVAEQFAGGISQLQRMPDEFGNEAFERAIGPWSATNPNPDSAAGIWGTGISVGNLGQMVARGVSEIDAALTGGAAPTEVRDRVETVTKNLAAVMKPLVRKAGEGAWSDKDQANLEAQIGLMTRARSVEEYNRRLADIKENVSKVFLVNVPEPKAALRSPTAPKTAEEEVTAFERMIGRGK